MHADVSIMPSMPMFTTPDRSHQSPAMAPSAIGVLRRSDSTSSCITFVSVDCDSARATTMTSGTKSNEAVNSATRATRSERRSKNVAMAQRMNTDADGGDDDRSGRR